MRPLGGARQALTGGMALMRQCAVRQIELGRGAL